VREVRNWDGEEDTRRKRKEDKGRHGEGRVEGTWGGEEGEQPKPKISL
jgi:hypothetical protein